jgi:hypothetical protein
LLALGCVGHLLMSWLASFQEDSSDSARKAWGATTEIEVAQSCWTRYIMTYVTYLHRASKKNPRMLSSIPILGPRFVPPSAPLAECQSHSSQVKVVDFYLKPLTVVHPFYKIVLGNVKICPGCRMRSTTPDISWSEWNPKGPRPVHGTSEEEFVIDYQMECKTCKKLSDMPTGDTVELMEKTQCNWSTTTPAFWSGIPYWRIPGMVCV